MRRRLALLLLAGAAGTALAVPAGASLREIAVGNFYYEDETVGDGKVEAQVGDQLRFNVLDGGPGTPHTVEIDELGVHSGSLSAGETFTTPPIGKAGTFILYCKPHDQRGHKTTLVVTGTATTPATAPAATTTTTAATPTTATPTTVTTTKATPTTKPPATTATTAPPTSGTAGSSATTTTTARATSTTAPTTATASGTGTTGTAAPGDPAAPAGTASVSGTPEGSEAGDGTIGETALVPTGRGTVDGESAAAGSLAELLDRRLRSRNGPWTRSIRLALVALLPMVLAAGLALRRWPGPPPDPGEQ